MSENAASSIETPPDEPRQARHRGVVGHYVEGGLESSPLAIQIISVIGSFVVAFFLTEPLRQALPEGGYRSFTVFCLIIAFCACASTVATWAQVKKISRRIDSRSMKGTTLAQSAKIGVKLYPATASVFGSGAAIAMMSNAISGLPAMLLWIGIGIAYLFTVTSDAITLNRVLSE